MSTIISLAFADLDDEHGVPVATRLNLLDSANVEVVETGLWDWQQVRAERPAVPHVVVPFVVVEVTWRGEVTRHRAVVGRFVDDVEAVRELDKFVDWLRQPTVQLTLPMA